MWVLPACMCARHMQYVGTWYSMKSEKDNRAPGTGATDGGWGVNQVPLEEQSVHLTAEPSLQLQIHVSLNLS